MEEENRNLSEEETVEVDEEVEFDEEEDGDVVELESEDGETIPFRHVATIDYENGWYVLFSPMQEMEGVGEDEVVIFRLDTDEKGGDIFVPVEDEAILDAVYDEYVRIMEDENSEWEQGCGCGHGDGEHCRCGEETGDGCHCDGESDGKKGDCHCGKSDGNKGSDCKCGGKSEGKKGDCKCGRH